MKTIIKITIASILLSFQLHAQKIDTNFYPEKSDNVTQEQYDVAKDRLTKTYGFIDNDPFRPLDFTDYWNTAYCYSFMKVEAKVVLDLLKKAKEDNPSLFCFYVQKTIEKYGNDYTKLRHYKLIGQEYIDLINGCEGVQIDTKNTKQK